jgi:hypothetical protein
MLLSSSSLRDGLFFHAFERAWGKDIKTIYKRNLIPRPKVALR